MNNKKNSLYPFINIEQFIKNKFPFLILMTNLHHTCKAQQKKTTQNQSIFNPRKENKVNYSIKISVCMTFSFTNPRKLRIHKQMNELDAHQQN